MYPCGADDLICPTGSVSPIQVQDGFFTTTEWSEGCKPGTWRNDSLAVDPFVPGNSFIPTEKLSPPCELCPQGSYKSTRYRRQFASPYIANSLMLFCHTEEMTLDSVCPVHLTNRMLWRTAPLVSAIAEKEGFLWQNTKSLTSTSSPESVMWFPQKK